MRCIPEHPSDRPARSSATWWTRAAVVGLLGLFLSLLLALITARVVDHARRDVIALHRPGSRVRYQSCQLSGESLVTLSFGWSDAQGRYTAYWGLRQWGPVNPPGWTR